MEWSDIPFRPGDRMLRQFAALWIVFFLAIGAHQYLANDRMILGLVLMALAVVPGLPGLVRPGLLRWVFVIWMVVAFPIGWMVSTLMLGMVYYLLITPVALLFRLRGRDLLARKPAPDRDTFWEERKNPLHVSSYFRQH